MKKTQSVRWKSTSRAFVRPDGVSFWDFLHNHHIAYEKGDFPFLTPTTIPHLKPVFDFDEYMHLESRGEALAYLYRGLGKALNYVGPVLDTEMPHGFNDHTDRHTLWVGERGVELLQRAGLRFDGQGYFDSATEVLMTLVGMLHDVGNLLGRERHSEGSVWLLENLFIARDRQKKAWQAVKYAVEYHEEPVLFAQKQALSQGMPLQWALVLADKMHFGRDRIGDRSFEAGLREKAFENDVHILLESLVVRSSWFMTSGVFIWHLDFSVDQLEDRFGSFVKGKSGRLWVPLMLQRRFLNQGKKYRDTFKELFLQHYGNRAFMAAGAARLLFPFITSFEVRLSDTDTRGKVGNGEMMIYREVIKQRVVPIMGMHG